MKASVVSILSTLVFSRQIASQELPQFCSCSPRKYSFTLTLSHTCTDDTLKDSPGMLTTVCSTDANVGVEDDWADILPDVGEVREENIASILSISTIFCLKRKTGLLIPLLRA